MKTNGKPLLQSEVTTGYGDDGTASKKLITDTRDSELNLSVHTVMSNEDLLIEILLRLPVISLLLFKVVSKHWLSIIKSHNFTSRHSRMPSMAPPSGIFLLRQKSKVLMQYEYDFLSLDSRIPSKRSITTFSFCFETGRTGVLDSCNGVLLLYDVYDSSELHVYNPTINLLKKLPRQSRDFWPGAIIAFDPTKSPHYKVLYPQIKQDVIQIQTYSSETNIWSVCDRPYPWQLFHCFNQGVYWNDAIHWLNVLSEMPLHGMLDVVDNTLITTKLPRPLDKRVLGSYKFFRSRGCLLLICKEYHDSRQLFVYEMRSWNSGWFAKYLINLDDIIMNPFPDNNYWSIHGCVWCYVLGEREEDTFMVINLCGQIFEYKPLLKTFRELLIMETICPRISSHEFISSFAGV